MNLENGPFPKVEFQISGNRESSQLQKTFQLKCWSSLDEKKLKSRVELRSWSLGCTWKAAFFPETGLSSLCVPETICSPGWSWGFFSLVVRLTQFYFVILIFILVLVLSPSWCSALRNHSSWFSGDHMGGHGLMKIAGSAMCKASSLPTVLSLQPQFYFILFFKCYFLFI